MFVYTAIGLILAMSLANNCNILALGDKNAKSLGINPNTQRIIISVIAVFLAGISTSYAGVIGFIGLVVPHISRMIMGSNHKVLLPFSAMLGALILLLADTLPLGAGAGGSMNGLALMNPILLKEYEKSITDFNMRRGMYFDNEYKEIVKFKGDIQTIFLPRNIGLYKDMDTYNQLLEKLLMEDMVEKVLGGFRLTHKGIFWGNTLSRELSSMIFST